MANPEVLSGLRSPRTVRLEEARARDAIAAGIPESAQAPPVGIAPAGVTVYVSKSMRYLVEVQNTPAYVHEGRRFPAKRIAAQFEEGVYRNDHRDLKMRAIIDEALQSNPYFGKFGDGAAHFWLASDQNARTQERRVQSALNTLKSLPKEVVEQYLKQGTAEDHELPPPAAPPSGIRPIPPSAL